MTWKTSLLILFATVMVAFVPLSTPASKLIEDNLVFIEYRNSKKFFKINPEFFDQLIYTLKISN